MKTGAIVLNTEMLDKLTKFQIFKGVEYSLLKLLLENSEVLTADKDEVLFKKGETYHKGIYLIISGQVELFSFSGQSAIANQGNFAGLSSFLSKTVYYVSAVAAENTELIFIPELSAYKLMEVSEEFRSRLYGMVVRRINDLAGKERSSLESSTFKPLRNYMTCPVVSISMSASVMEASQLMSENNIGALVVVDENGLLAGLLTAKHLVHRFIANLESSLLAPSVKNFMDKEPLILPSEFPLADALLEMQSKYFEYALVSRKNKPVGIISNNDIMRVLFRHTSVHSSYIEGLSELDELKNSHSELYKNAEALVNTSRLTYDVLPMLSAIHLNIQKKVYQLTAKQFEEETGFDVNKVRHTLIIMGSGGRKEMMLDPDQDNGFIFDDNVSDEEIQTFLKFGELYTENLAYVGYEKCNGNVMVSNPEMSMRISDWKSKIRNWIDGSSVKSILWSNIVFDFDGLVGDEDLVWELREYINMKIAQKPVFIIYILENDLNQRKPISLFGKFITEKEGEHIGKINMKVAALAFIVDVTRAFALRFGLNELNTIERLQHLKRKKVLSDELVAQTQEAYETLVDITMNEQIRQASSGESVNKYVNPETLSLYSQEKLRKSLNHMTKYLNTSLRYFKGHF